MNAIEKKYERLYQTANEMMVMLGAYGTIDSDASVVSDVMDALYAIDNGSPSQSQIGGGHYKDMPIQPAEFCQKNNLNFCESAVIKYICRHKNKNGAEDIEKAIHFLHLLLEWEYNKTAKTGLISDLYKYQLLASETAIYPTLGHPIVYPALGLAGEAGEVAEKVKKMCRDDGCVLTDDRRAALKKELGDVLWYVSETARQADLVLDEIAWANIDKLKTRQANGQLQGSGDDR